MNLSICMMTGRSGYGIMCALAYSMCPAQLSAQCEVQKLTASDTAAFGMFGGSVSLDDDLAVIGAAGDDHCAPGFACGAAYVYRFNGMTWIDEQKLTASHTAASDYFGESVSVSGGVALVGASFHDCVDGEDCGAAYVYRVDPVVPGIWVFEQKLTASGAAAYDYFGRSVAVSGDLSVVGAFSADCTDTGLSCGAVYVYRFNGTTWIEEQRLTASDQIDGDYFGESVSVSGGVILVGARFRDCAAGSNCGMALVYRQNGSTWVEEQKLTASDADSEAEFGYAVSISDDVVLIGAPSAHCTNASYCGAAYVYRFDGLAWLEEQKLTASDAAGEGSFGHSVSVWGGRALVGAPGANGGAYLYQLNSGLSEPWAEQAKLTPLDGTFSWGGWSAVALNDTSAIVGARGGDCPGAPGCGSAHVFAFGPDCNENDEGDICEIRNCSPTDPSCQDCNTNTRPDECEILDGGDFDGDGQLTLLDFRALPECMSGPDTRPIPLVKACTEACLEAFDIELDQDVDLADYARLQRSFR